MISQELEVTLHMAFVDARQQRHEFITVEHLLLALIDNPSASDILKACAPKFTESRHLFALRDVQVSGVRELSRTYLAPSVEFVDDSKTL